MQLETLAARPAFWECEIGAFLFGHRINRAALKHLDLR